MNQTWQGSSISRSLTSTCSKRSVSAGFDQSRPASAELLCAGILSQLRLNSYLDSSTYPSQRVPYLYVVRLFSCHWTWARTSWPTSPVEWPSLVRALCFELSRTSVSQESALALSGCSRALEMWSHRSAARLFLECRLEGTKQSYSQACHSF